MRPLPSELKGYLPTNISMPYQACPTYLFACPILDHLTGVTHALTSGENIELPDMYGWLAMRLAIRAPVRCQVP